MISQAQEFGKAINYKTPFHRSSYRMLKYSNRAAKLLISH